MKRRNLWLILLLLAVFGGQAFATSVGLGIGLDPTGLIIASAITELPLVEYLDLRAEVGFATDEIAGLMMATIGILGHYAFPPLEPFVGLGIGAALTPPPFSTGFVAEGYGGLRVTPFEPVFLYLQARLIARYRAPGWTIGPIYEAGMQVRF